MYLISSILVFSLAGNRVRAFQLGVPAFTVKQPEDAMVTLSSRASEMRVSDPPSGQAGAEMRAPVIRSTCCCSVPCGCVQSWRNTRRTVDLCIWAWQDGTSAPTPPSPCSSVTRGCREDVYQVGRGRGGCFMSHQFYR